MASTPKGAQWGKHNVCERACVCVCGFIVCAFACLVMNTSPLLCTHACLGCRWLVRVCTGGRRRSPFICRSRQLRHCLWQRDVEAKWSWGVCERRGGHHTRHGRINSMEVSGASSDGCWDKPTQAHSCVLSPHSGGTDAARNCEPQAARAAKAAHRSAARGCTGAACIRGRTGLD